MSYEFIRLFFMGWIMSLLRDDVRMVLCLADSDEESGDLVWEFRTANPLLQVLNLGVLHEYYRDVTKTKKFYRIHIPHTSETRNAVFETRDSAVNFVNEFILRYR